MDMLAKIVLAMLICMYQCGESRELIVIDYGGFETLLQPYLHDVKDQFYIDIGAYDPYFLSLSQQLYLRGWTGVNVDAGYQRLKNFYKLRPGTISINQAIDKEERYAQMVEMPDDSASGITSTYTPTKENRAKIDDSEGKKYSVPTMSMKTLCERFYHKKPVFMTMDVEGNEGRALESNDWQNPKCRPQLLMAQVIGEIQISQNGVKLRNGQTAIEQIMQANGYKLLLDSRPNPMWVQADRFNYYKQKYNSYNEQKQNHKHINYQLLMQQLFVQFLGHQTYYFIFHYDAQTYPLTLYISIPKQPLIISNLDEMSRKQYSKANRPIFVFQYNPNDSLIILGDAALEDISQIKINYRKLFDLHFWRLKGKNAKDGQQFTVYILNHQYMDKNFKLQIKKINDYSKEDFIVFESSPSYIWPFIISLILIMAIVIVVLDYKVRSLKNKPSVKNQELAQSESLGLSEVR